MQLPSLAPRGAARHLPVRRLCLDAAVSRFNAAEITDAHAAVHERVAEFVRSGDGSGYADLFTPDAVYVEHAMGTFRAAGGDLRQADRELATSGRLVP